MPAPLTVVVPTLDEEALLPDCLASVAWADERIVVDSGSRDGTVAAASAAGARSVVRPFTGYGDQRNHGAALARHDWILCLDADERATPELREEIERLLARGPALPGYRIPRRSRFAGREIRHCGWQRDRVLRLYDRRRARWDDRLVHERVVLDGAARPGDLAAPLLHLTYRSLAQFAEKNRRYAERGALELRRRGKQAGPAGLVLLPAARFLKMYVLERGFLDGVPGLVLCVLAAHGVFLKHARLWELGRTGE